MHTGTGKIVEIHLDGSTRLECPPNLIPAPGQYLLAHNDASDSPLPVPVFFYDSAPNGFRFAPSLPSTWNVGTRLNLRGPLGHGFSLTNSSHKIALIAFDESAAFLHGLIQPALKQGAEVVLVSQNGSAGLPEAVEVQPLSALAEVCKWADFIAVDLTRERLDQLKKMFQEMNQISAVRDAQVLIHTPMPCGGVAECGVCAVTVRHDWLMACKDGPVFPMKELL